MYFASDTEVGRASVSNKLPIQFISHMQSWDISATNSLGRLHTNWDVKFHGAHWECVMCVWQAKQHTEESAHNH